MVNISASFWKNKKILLTGHTGFKGAWFSIILNKYHSDVHGISLPPSDENYLYNKLPKNIFESENFFNICDIPKLEYHVNNIQPDIVVHFAAQSLVLPSYEYPVETFNTNIMGTVNILDICRRSKSVKMILIITSDKVYQNDESGLPFKEDDKLGGYDSYSASKSCAEIVTNSYRYSFYSGNDSPSLVSVRAGNVIGGGDYASNRLIPDIFRSINSSSLLTIRSKSSVRPWQHVLEPLYMYMSIIQKAYYKKNIHYNYNIGPTATAFRTVYEVIQEVNKYISIPNVHYENINNEKESNLLKICNDRVINEYDYKSVWSFECSINKTVNWYVNDLQSLSPFDLCHQDIIDYELQSKIN